MWQFGGFTTGIVFVIWLAHCSHYVFHASASPHVMMPLKLGTCVRFLGLLLGPFFLLPSFPFPLLFLLPFPFLSPFISSPLFPLLLVLPLVHLSLSLFFLNTPSGAQGGRARERLCLLSLGYLTVIISDGHSGRYFWCRSWAWTLLLQGYSFYGFWKFGRDGCGNHSKNVIAMALMRMVS